MTPNFTHLDDFIKRFGVCPSTPANRIDVLELAVAVRNALTPTVSDHHQVMAGFNEVGRLKRFASISNDEICQTLGKALGYPKYKDDPKNFPGHTNDDVCVGDHVAESIAMEAAKKIKELQENMNAIEPQHVTRQLLLAIVDKTWNEATESTAVPSMEWAGRIVDECIIIQPKE